MGRTFFLTTNLSTKSLLASFSCIALLFSSGANAETSSAQVSEPKSAAVKPTVKIRWLVAHGPANLVEKSLKQMQQALDKRSNGEIKLEIVVKDRSAYSPLTPIVAMKMVQDGQYEMAQIYTTAISNAVDPRFMVFDVPYLFRDHDHASAVLDGPIGQDLLAGLDKHGLKGLGFTYSGGYRVIATSGKKFEQLSDFKGANILSMGGQKNKVIVETFETLGATPTSGNPKFVRNLFDASPGKYAIETTYTRFWNKGEDKALTTINETFHSLHLTSVVMNKDFFEKLSNSHRKLLAEAAQELAVLERKHSVELSEESRARAKAQGIEIVSMSGENRSSLIEKLRGVGRAGRYPFSGDLIKKIEATKPEKVLTGN